MASSERAMLSCCCKSGYGLARVSQDEAAAAYPVQPLYSCSVAIDCSRLGRRTAVESQLRSRRGIYRY